jgi:hypothetical protein
MLGQSLGNWKKSEEEGQFKCYVINEHNVLILKWVSVQLHCILKEDLLRNKCNLRDILKQTY